MKTKINILAGFTLLLISSIQATAQDFRTFNQNSSRTNHISSSASSGLTLTFSPLFSTSLNKNNDSLLFRGNGGGFRIMGDYFFGKAGIGFSSGFGSSVTNDNSINHFLQSINVLPDQVTISKSNQQNMYLLLGPSVRFGNNVEMLLHAQGGLFINNSGIVIIQQKGAVRAAYMNSSTEKSIYPGFQTGFNVQYKTKSDVWSFGIGADYMGTKTEINNYDARRNGGTDGLKLSQTISDIVAGINIRYNIGAIRNKQNYGATQRLLPTVNKKNITIDESGTYVQRLLPTVNKRDIAIDEPGVQIQRVLPTVNKKEIVITRNDQTGQVTERLLPTVNKRDIAIDEPGVSVERLLPTVNKKEIAIDEPGVQRMSTQSSCGPVTIRTTNPDGSVSETTFACPADAAAYNQRLSMTPTTSKQTQNNSFGEKVQQGLQREGIIHRDLAARNILVGKVSFVTGNVAGIETNETISSTERKRPGKMKYNNINVSLYAREVGSGMATGRRQYQPVFSDEDTSTCTDCIAAVVSNPLYYKMSGAGENPMYEDNGRQSAKSNDDCDGVSGLTVLLIDETNGAVIASTKTEACGNFFFANLPSGPYAVKFTGTIISKKGYDVTLKNKADVAGELLSADDHWTIEFNTGTGTAEQAAAVIKTKTKSNQSNDRVTTTQEENNGIIWSPKSNLKVLPISWGDLDGDGISDLVAGNSFDGGIALRPTDPIPGVDVILKDATGNGMNIPVDENGQFQLTNLKAGNYKIIMGQTMVLNDETVLWVGDNDSDYTSGNNFSLRAQNNNTVRSNRTDNALTMNNDNGNNKNVIVRGWDPAKKESVEKNINTSEDNLKTMEALLDVLDQQLNTDNSNPQAAINNAHSNIKNLKNAIADAQQTMDNLQQKEKDVALQELDQKMTAMNMQFLSLQDTVSKMGKQYTTVSNVLKTRHDMAMNAIRNMK